MLQELSRAGIVALFGIFVGLIPLFVAVSYMFRPTDRTLALMRPLTLATVFAGLNTLFSGFAAAFRNLPRHKTPDGYELDWLMYGLAETVTPMFVACGFLAAAWRSVASGRERHSMKESGPDRKVRPGPLSRSAGLKSRPTHPRPTSLLASCVGSRTRTSRCSPRRRCRSCRLCSCRR